MEDCQRRLWIDLGLIEDDEQQSQARIPRREGNTHRDLSAAKENPQGLLKKQNPTSWLGVGGLGHRNPDYSASQGSPSHFES